MKRKERVIKKMLDAVNDVKVTFGYHLVLDLLGCDSQIASEQAIRNFASGLCTAIGMKAFGDPVIQHFGWNSEITKGYSLVQLIETSSIVAHFSEHYRSAHIDIFSCKEFDFNVAEHFCVNAFGGKVGARVEMTRYCK